MKIRSFEDILTRMVVYFKGLCKKVTDFSVGSTIRTLFESVAIEIEEFYFALSSAIEEAIRESVYNTFGFPRRESLTATTDITFYFSPHPNSTITIPKNFEVMTDNNIVFRTVDEVIVGPDEVTKSVLAVCSTPGIEGNVGPNTLIYHSQNLPYLLNVTNQYQAFGGTLAERESERKERFINYIKSLGRGTAEALYYALSTIPEITSISISESLPGIVKIYISTATGIVSDEIMNKAKEAIEKYRAAGVQVIITTVAKIPVDISVQIGLSSLQSDSIIKTQVYNGIVNYLNNMKVGEDFLPNNLMGFIFSLNFPQIKTVEVLQPSTKLIVAPHSVIRPGNITIMTYLEEDL